MYKAVERKTQQTWAIKEILKHSIKSDLAERALKVPWQPYYLQP